MALSDFHVAATIPVGHAPTGIAVNPARNELYVVNSESDNVSFIDARQNKVVATVGVHHQPYFIAVASRVNEFSLPTA